MTGKDVPWAGRFPKCDTPGCTNEAVLTHTSGGGVRYCWAHDPYKRADYPETV